MDAIPCIRAKSYETVNAIPVMVDRGKFATTWRVYALRVPSRFCDTVRKLLKPHLLSLPRVQAVVKRSTPDDDALFLLLRYLAEHAQTGTAAVRGNLLDTHVGLPSDVADLLAACYSSCDASQSTIRSFISAISETAITVSPVLVTYANCTIEHVLRELIPPDLPVPTSFETIGHIAHMNLRDEHIPWKILIGDVMLDKLAPRIRTIVNKTNSTGGPYRTFAMEVLAGEPNFVTSVKENGCTFIMDFAKVYWNSRLETEHRRMVQSLRKDDVLVDAFCGVGPFSLPAAKRAICAKVYANDLNPSSVQYLDENIKKNNVPQSRIETSCGCARDFIKQLIVKNVGITKVLMNFPSGAPEFLDMFRGLYCDWSSTSKPPMPLIHCYCFVKESSDVTSARERIRNNLFDEYREQAAGELPDSKINVRVVRDVAPRKVQVCATFQLPEQIAFTGEQKEPSAQPTKKQKVEVVKNKTTDVS